MGCERQEGADFPGDDRRAQEIAVHPPLATGERQQAGQWRDGEKCCGQDMPGGQGQGRGRRGEAARGQGRRRRPEQGVPSQPRSHEGAARPGQNQAAQPAEDRGEEQGVPGPEGDGAFEQRRLGPKAQDKPHDPESPDAAVLDDGPEPFPRGAAAPAVPEVGPAVPVQAAGDPQVQARQDPGQDPGRERQKGGQGQDEADERPDQGIHAHGAADLLVGGDAGPAQAGQEGQGDEEVAQRTHGRCPVQVRRSVRPGARPRRSAHDPPFTASSMTPWLPARSPTRPGARSA